MKRMKNVISKAFIVIFFIALFMGGYFVSWHFGIGDSTFTHILMGIAFMISPFALGYFIFVVPDKIRSDSK